MALTYTFNFRVDNHLFYSIYRRETKKRIKAAAPKLVHLQRAAVFFILSVNDR